ncbi:MAG TPA: DivIVA domain-containing protein, partial [Kribbella sp.]|nr:DivIVA domain-containing protein [Kribbella sp.]
MMWFFGLIVVLLIGAVAVVASGRWGAMSTAYDDRPDMTVPARQALTSTDIESARFGVGLRGYRMDEVDTLLERVAKEVAERDSRIADLERAVAPIVEAPEGSGFTSRGSYDPAEFDDTGVQAPILVGGNFPESATPSPEPAEPVTAEQPAVEHPTSGPAPSGAEQPSAGQAPTEPSAAGQSAGEQHPTVGQSAVGQPILGESATERAAVEQSTLGQSTAEQPGHGQSAAEQPGHAPSAAEPITAGQPAVGQSAVDPRAAEPAQSAPAAQASAADDDEEDTREVRQTRHIAAADEYERLQAEARAVLDAQSQPTTARRRPADPNQLSTPKPPPAPASQNPEADTRQQPETRPQHEPATYAQQHPEARAPQQPDAYTPQQPRAYTPQQSGDYASQQPEASALRQSGVYTSQQPEVRAPQQPEGRTSVVDQAESAVWFRGDVPAPVQPPAAPQQQAAQPVYRQEQPAAQQQQVAQPAYQQERP